ncbi:MAG: hypothetical protein SFW07_02695, partial [Gammaproteobacteria bacterium]|nr:hypothetical protein [Gammaproteobacteria bacterium]
MSALKWTPLKNQFFNKCDGANSHDRCALVFYQTGLSSDSSYASLIGETNSVSDSTLKMGDRLVLPAMFESRFNSNTSEPYQIFAQQ